jgi:hypothetical protein
MLILQLLNAEMLCIEFLDRSIDDLTLSAKLSPELKKRVHLMRAKAFLLQVLPRTSGEQFCVSRGAGFCASFRIKLISSSPFLLAQICSNLQLSRN